MGDGFYGYRLQQGQNACHVNARRFEQGFEERTLAQHHVQGSATVRENLTNKRKSVGVGPAGCQPEDDVSRHHLAAVDDGVVLHHADAETRQVVIRIGVHAGHLGRLAANERHARQLAAAGDARDDLVRHCLVELAGGVVVEKVKRFGTLDDDVVGAHGDQVDAHAVMVSRVDGQAQFGAYTVGSGDQYRPAIAIHRQLEQPSEAAEAGHDAPAPGCFGQWLDALDKAIAAFDIDAGIAISDGITSRGGHARNGTHARMAAQTLTWPRPLHSVVGMRVACRFSLCLVFLAWILSAPVFAAGEVKNLYEAEINVVDKDPGVRTEAFGLALMQVAIKVSGRRGAAASPVIVEAITDPSRFVQQFRYRNVATASSEDPSSQSPTLNLWVQFDAPAVDGLMREAGMPVWGRVRPSVLVLVAVESAAGRELLSSDDAGGWADFVRRIGDERAVPLVLPLMDLEDRASLRVSDVWAGFDDSVQGAAQRYQSEGVLLGRAYERLPNFWEARWRLLLEDGRHEWVDQGEGLDAVLLAGVHEGADRLASRFGGSTATTVASGVEVNVAGIRSLGDYARTLNYLDALDEVSRVDVTRVDRDSVSFRLDARGGRETVRQVIALGHVLAEDAQEDLDAGLSYRLLP